MDWNNRFDPGVKGTIRAIRGDTIVLEQAGGADTTAVHLQPSFQVFVWEGKGSAGGLGAAMGAGLGAVVATVTEAFKKADCSAGAWMCFDGFTAPLINVLAGGATGLMAGWIIGDLIPTDRWVRLLPGPADLRPILSPAPGGWSFGARWSF